MVLLHRSGTLGWHHYLETSFIKCSAPKLSQLHAYNRVKVLWFKKSPWIHYTDNKDLWWASHVHGSTALTSTIHIKCGNAHAIHTYLEFTWKRYWFKIKLLRLQSFLMQPSDWPNFVSYRSYPKNCQSWPRIHWYRGWDGTKLILVPCMPPLYSCCEEGYWGQANWPLCCNMPGVETGGGSGNGGNSGEAAQISIKSITSSCACTARNKFYAIVVNHQLTDSKKSFFWRLSPYIIRHKASVMTSVVIFHLYNM